MCKNIGLQQARRPEMVIHERDAKDYSSLFQHSKVAWSFILIIIEIFVSVATTVDALYDSSRSAWQTTAIAKPARGAPRPRSILIEASEAVLIAQISSTAPEDVNERMTATSRSHVERLFHQ